MLLAPVVGVLYFFKIGIYIDYSGVYYKKGVIHL